MKNAALEALTTPKPTPFQLFAIYAAEWLMTCYPTLPRPSERNVFKYLLKAVYQSEGKKMVFDPQESKSVGIMVNLIMDIWAYRLQENKL